MVSIPRVGEEEGDAAVAHEPEILGWTSDAEQELILRVALDPSQGGEGFEGTRWDLVAQRQLAQRLEDGGGHRGSMVATSASPVRQCLRAAAGWPSRVATPWCCNRLKVVHATSEKPPWATATLMFVALVGCKAPAQPAVAALTAPETEPGPPVSQPPSVAEPSVAEPSPPVFTLEGYEADVRAALSGQPTDGGARFGRIMWSRVARLVPDGPVFGNSDAVRHEWGLEAILDPKNTSLRNGYSWEFKGQLRVNSISF